MIVVTGTKRSGTSMWMQVLAAAGFPYFGVAFPTDWRSTLKPANPRGFFESTLRNGINHATNPDPSTGVYFAPQDVAAHAVKVFIPGVVCTERSFLNVVILTMRPWREYCVSLERLRSLERSTGRTHVGLEAHLPPHLEWWHEHYMFVRDVVTRRYPCHAVSFRSMLEDPRRVIESVLPLIGPCDVESAVQVVDSSVSVVSEEDARLHTYEFGDVFDALYERLRDARPIDDPFVRLLNETHAKIAPELKHHVERIQAVRLERRLNKLRDSREAPVKP